MVMTQQEFVEKLEAAHSWMQAVQERLKANDNTLGPINALKDRLQETECIHQSQHEGLARIDMVMVAAEGLLQSGDENLRNQTHSQLKEMKNDWEETCTYIVHCHSRIEWVWLHWSEYLKALEEFELWLLKQQRVLDVGLELQLGVKEKLWQVDLHRVLMSDIHSQATLLERLLEEGAFLYNQTQDSSLEPHSQEKLQEVYNDIRDRAEERSRLLHKIAEDHQTLQGCCQRFHSWLLSKTQELTQLMEKEDTPELKLEALQLLDGHIASEEKTLLYIEDFVETVRANTSPAGAEVLLEEAEELRLGWQRLRQGLCEAEEGLRVRLDSHSQYVTRCQRLGEDIGRLRVLLRGLDQELEKGAKNEGDCTEKQLLDQWTKYVSLRNTLAGEESRVEQLKSQLKELLRFSANPCHLSDDVLTVVKEHQSAKCRATKLCSESESGLRNSLQDPLFVYNQWNQMVSEVLEVSAEVNDFSNIAMLVKNIECLLKDGEQLQERLHQVQGMASMLKSIFGSERSETYRSELASALKNRELRYTQLLQRKNRLQGLLSRTKDIDGTYQVIRSKLDAMQDRLVSADGLQPDILAKKSQSDQFRAIQTELEDYDAHITALETLISSSQSNKSLLDKLKKDWRLLHNRVKMKVQQCEEGVALHESFHENLLNIEKWLIISSQKLKSFLNPSGHGSIEGREHEAQRILQEFPEKELQIQQVEAMGQQVLQRTSEEGRVHIITDLEQLQESWLALNKYSSILHRVVHSTNLTEPDASVGGGLSEAEVEVDDEMLAAVECSTKPGDLVADSSPAVNMEENLGIITSQSLDGLKLDVQEEELYPRSNYGEKVDSSFYHAQNDGDSDSDSRRQILAGIGMTIDGMTEEQNKFLGKQGAAPVQRFHPSEHKKSFSQTTVKGDTMASRREEFEAWLCRDNELLSGIINPKSWAVPNSKQLKLQQQTLKALKEGLGWGQEHFQLLLEASQEGENAAELEELRYHWMLYKSKLKAAENLHTRLVAKKDPVGQEKLNRGKTLQKSPGLMQRVCRLALPLWLFLLALLLLAFLLPLVDDGSSCSLSNNFARSFNIMLRYQGPPPT
ncbi:nesprin-3 isoform 1-T3 [Synchiropus picturatus]